MEEFIEQVERVLRSREQTTEERCDYILSLLRGPALEEAVHEGSVGGAW